MIIKQLWRYTGIIVVVISWIILGISIYQNPWFNIFVHAFSDLGKIEANCPWIFNTGLMILGCMTCIYSLYLAYSTMNKFYIYSSALMFIAGIFLILIGVFPINSKYHDFVSIWFFIQMWLSLITTAIGMTINRKFLYSVILWIIVVIGPLGSMLIEWPSIALLETYGIMLINIYVIVLTINF